MYNQYKKVLQAMKKDYSALVGKSVKISRKYHDIPKGMEVVTVQDSSFERNRRKR